MAFLQARPSLGLRPHIMSYWAFQGQADSVLKDYTYPDGCPEIIFNIGTDVLKQDVDGGFFENPAIEVIGQLTRPYRVRARGNQLYFGVRFHPHGLSAFSPVSIGELNNQNVDARDVFSTDIQCLLDHCRSLDTFSHFVRQADHYFAQRAVDSTTQREPYNLVKACIHTLQSTHHAFSISDLCKHYSVSTRWLQIQFKNHVGVSPKTLQKILRFQSCLRLLNNNTVPLISVATDGGYYDQAHFNREFKAFSGVAPKLYQERTHPINQHFLDGCPGHTHA